MKNLTYDQLSPDAQSEAIFEVDKRNPVNTRSKIILDLCQDYEYNKYGEIMEDSSNIEGNGDEPEYRDY